MATFNIDAKDIFNYVIFSHLVLFFVAFRERETHRHTHTRAHTHTHTERERERERERFAIFCFYGVIVLVNE